MSEHSPLPWSVQCNPHYLELHSDRDGQIGDLCASKTIYHDQKPVDAEICEQIANANANLIVRAVNAHAELVAALTKIASGTEDTVFPFRCLPESEMKRIARDALAKVTP